MPLNQAASGRTPQPGPTRPDGSFDPHRGRGLWGNKHGPVTPTPADEAFDAEVGDGQAEFDIAQILVDQENATQRQRLGMLNWGLAHPLGNVPPKKSHVNTLLKGNEIRWSRDYSPEEWARFHQHQTGNDDCNAFALAMAHNLVYADDPTKPYFTGDEVQKRLERHLGLVPSSPRTLLRWQMKYGRLLPFGPVLAPNKVPRLGIPTWQFDNAIKQILPDAHVEHYQGAKTSDLKQAISQGKVVIVAVGWESNGKIITETTRAVKERIAYKLHLRTEEPKSPFPAIGHYMVAVGYDAKNVYLLNPALVPDAVQPMNWNNFLQHWSQGNFAIEPNSMWTIDKEK